MEIKFQPSNIDFKFEISLLVYFFSAFIIYQLPQRIEPCILYGKPFNFGCLFDLAVHPAFFALGNFLFYFILKHHIILRAIIAVILGIIISIVKFLQNPGIIDPVYFFILSTSYAVILVVYKGAYFEEKLREIHEFNEVTDKLIDYLRDGYKYILGKAFQGWLGLGASLGISMSILFRGGFEDPHLKFTALKMLVGFILISLAIGFWVGIPMLNGMVRIQESLHSLKLKDDSQSLKG